MRTLPLCLIALAFVAGCFGGEATPNERAFSATGGSVRAGWGYDGGALVGGSATLDGVTYDEANNGTVHVTFLLDEVAWTVHFDTFAQAADRPFMDGGVEHALDEHGDTGVADASIPRIHALVAAWGSASVLEIQEPVTQEPWSAHLMVSADTVRGSDGKITKADGATPYDPAAPADARRIEGDPQAIFWIKHPQGETFARGPAGAGANISCQGPACSQTADISFEAGAKQLDLNVTYTPSGPLPLAVGRARLSIVDAAGTTVVEGSDVQVVPGPTPTTAVISTPLDGYVPPLTIQLTGDGAFDVRIDGAITYVDHPFLVITWNEPVVE